MALTPGPIARCRRQTRRLSHGNRGLHGRSAQGPAAVPRRPPNVRHRHRHRREHHCDWPGGSPPRRLVTRSAGPHISTESPPAASRRAYWPRCGTSPPKRLPSSSRMRTATALLLSLTSRSAPVTPGQAVVLYNDGRMLGGGVIERAVAVEELQPSTFTAQAV